MEENNPAIGIREIYEPIQREFPPGPEGEMSWWTAIHIAAARGDVQAKEYLAAGYGHDTLQPAEVFLAIMTAAFEAEHAKAGRITRFPTLNEAADFQCAVKKAAAAAIQQHPMREEIIYRLAEKALDDMLQDGWHERGMVCEDEERLEHEQTRLALEQRVQTITAEIDRCMRAVTAEIEQRMQAMVQ